ncbi:MAG: cobalamin-independent methionine synthase II family protein [Acidimicrobiia bacterium]
MRTSTDRILTTHVGSLPRPQPVVDVLFAQDRGEPYDQAAFDAVIAAGVDDAVQHQVEAGIDIVDDGEMSKISYGTYIRHRLSGFVTGDVPRQTPEDLNDFPEFRDRLTAAGATPVYLRPICTGPIESVNLQPLHTDIAHVKDAIARTGAMEGFMTAASPGTIAVFQPNEHYPSHEAYLGALADAMEPEYRAIVDAGLILQIDCPDLAMGRHMLFRHDSDEEFVRNAELQVEALNHAVRNIPADRMRMHMCWGNYAGPHTHDIALTKVLPTALKAKPMGLLIEGANARHGHEWEVFATHRLPDDKVLVPGVLDSTSNIVEHPELVAQRIIQYARLVGKERVIAGTDCGFGTFAGFGAVHPSICWEKLRSLSEGAARASERLWGSS